jgi:hypothetical protein
VLANVLGLAFSNTRGLSVPSFYILYALHSFPFRPLILSSFFFFFGSLSFVSGAGRSSPVLVDGENATTLTVPHRKLLERGESFSFFFSIFKYEFDFLGPNFLLVWECIVWCQKNGMEYCFCLAKIPSIPSVFFGWLSHLASRPISNPHFW